MPPTKPTPRFTDVDAYIAAADPAARPTLEALRALVLAGLPQAAEAIAYNVPFYRLPGGGQLGFSVAKAHATFGPGEAAITDALRQALTAKGYRVNKGTIQIRFDQAAPAREIAAMLRSLS